jgi:hypothetical protein
LHRKSIHALIGAIHGASQFIALVLSRRKTVFPSCAFKTPYFRGRFFVLYNYTIFILFCVLGQKDGAKTRMRKERLKSFQLFAFKPLCFLEKNVIMV